jgi:DNA replication and repair protein RecF
VRLGRLEVRGFRNLRDGVLDWAPEGALFLGANGQGKTSLLEAMAYPALFRSLRGSPDAEIAAFGGTGFRVVVEADAPPPVRLDAAWHRSPRRKQVLVDGAPPARLADAVGRWLAVAFLPTDVALAAGAASERRRFLDRMLSMAERPYLVALIAYRAALAQRNAALRQGRPDLARVFDPPLAEAGSALVRRRLAWAAWAAERFGEELGALGEPEPATLDYVGHEALTDPASWPAALTAAQARDAARGMTTLGPHRDDVRLTVAGRGLRAFGSSGQQRSGAVALRLLELETVRAARGTEPVLLLDDVYAELDGRRQERLAERLAGVSRQVFLTAPRRDEAPVNVHLPVWEVRAGVARRAD